MQQKAQLRKLIRQERSQISRLDWQKINQALGTQIRAICERLQPKRVFSYVATDEEPDTFPGLADIKMLALPVVGSERLLRFYPWRFGESLNKNRFGILEPFPTGQAWVPTAEDVMFVPCLAMCGRGVRLGFGGGFYDTFLSHHRGLQTIGVCLERFVYESLPKEEHDISLDWLVTENAVRASAGRA